MPERNVPEVEGLWDDAKELLKWRPALALLARLERETTPQGKMGVIRDLVAFFMRTGLDVDPYQNRAFLTLALVADLTVTDERVRALVSGIVMKTSRGNCGA